MSGKIKGMTMTESKKPAKNGKKKKFSQEFLDQQFKAKGEEPNNKTITIRIPQSLKDRLDKFREENGRYPHQEIREAMDKIIPHY
jgi:hypothetical protein